MDSGLWDPPVYEDDSLGDDWLADFRFWREPDPAEVDAANEQACIQVLRILITKADTEITELEEEIILLQSQLAWTEKSWSEMCFIALSEKIKSLEMSIKRLMNDKLQDHHQGDVQQQLHRQPAEKIHEILKPLLDNYFLHKDEQNASSNVESLVFSQSKDETTLINSVAEVCAAKTSGQTTMPLCSEAQTGKEDQIRDTIITDHLADVPVDAFEESNQRDKDMTNAESSTEQGTKNRDLTKARRRIYRPENDELSDKIPVGMPNVVERVTNRSIMKEPVEGEEDASQANKIDPQKQLVTMGKMGTRSSLEGRKNDEWLNDRECTIDESLRKLLYNKRKEAGKPEMKLTPIPQILEQMQHTEVTGPEESQLNLLLKHELKQEPCSQQEPPPAQEPLLAVEMELKPSSMTNVQNWKTMIMEKHAGSSSANRSIRRTILEFKRKRGPSTAPDAGVTLDSQSENKLQHSSISPIVNESNESGNIKTMTKRHKDIAHGMIQNRNCQTNEACVDEHLKSFSSSFFTQREPDLALEFLPMDTLKKLAKVNGLTGYSKLRKEELLKILRAKSRDGDWLEI